MDKRSVKSDSMKVQLSSAQKLLALIPMYDLALSHCAVISNSLFFSPFLPVKERQRCKVIGASAVKFGGRGFQFRPDRLARVVSGQTIVQLHDRACKACCFMPEKNIVAAKRITIKVQPVRKIRLQLMFSYILYIYCSFYQQAGITLRAPISSFLSNALKQLIYTLLSWAIKFLSVRSFQGNFDLKFLLGFFVHFPKICLSFRKSWLTLFCNQTTF